MSAKRFKPDWLIVVVATATMVAACLCLTPSSLPDLRRIADQCLRVGLEQREVDRILAERRIDLMFDSHSFLGEHRYYGTGNLSDPVLVVATKREADGLSYVTEWEVQE
jgi:hypothetical protein